MTRYHAKAEGKVPFTAAEEAEWDAKEALYISLAARQGRMLKRIKKIAKRTRDSGSISVATTVGDITINTDQEARGLAVGAKVGGKAGRGWVKKNGDQVALSKTDVDAISDGIDDYLQAVFDKQGALNTSVNSATSDAELDAIDIKAGWPS